MIKMKTYKPNYKFRGKYEKTDKFVYGNLIKFPNRSFIIESITWDEYRCNNDINKCVFVDGSSTRNIYNSPLAIYRVEKNSVAQLIGYDKNFNEIYEDDYLIDIMDNQRIIIATEALKEYEFCDIFSNYILKE